MPIILAIAVWILFSFGLVIAFGNLPNKTDATPSSKKRKLVLIAVYVYGAYTLALIGFIIFLIFAVLGSY